MIKPGDGMPAPEEEGGPNKPWGQLRDKRTVIAPPMCSTDESGCLGANDAVSPDSSPIVSEPMVVLLLAHHRAGRPLDDLDQRRMDVDGTGDEPRVRVRCV